MTLEEAEAALEDAERELKDAEEAHEHELDSLRDELKEAQSELAEYQDGATGIEGAIWDWIHRLGVLGLDGDKTALDVLHSLREKIDA